MTLSIIGYGLIALGSTIGLAALAKLSFQCSHCRAWFSDEIHQMADGGTITHCNRCWCVLQVRVPRK